MKIIKVKSQAFDVVVRWIHLVALAVGVGGVGFVALVLFPSMPVLPTEQQGAMGGALKRLRLRLKHQCHPFSAPQECCPPAGAM